MPDPEKPPLPPEGQQPPAPESSSARMPERPSAEAPTPEKPTEAQPTAAETTPLVTERTLREEWGSGPLASAEYFRPRWELPERLGDWMKNLSYGVRVRGVERELAALRARHQAAEGETRRFERQLSEQTETAQRLDALREELGRPPLAPAERAQRAAELSRLGEQQDTARAKMEQLAGQLAERESRRAAYEQRRADVRERIAARVEEKMARVDAELRALQQETDQANARLQTSEGMLRELQGHRETLGTLQGREMTRADARAVPREIAALDRRFNLLTGERRRDLEVVSRTRLKFSTLAAIRRTWQQSVDRLRPAARAAASPAPAAAAEAAAPPAAEAPATPEAAAPPPAEAETTPSPESGAPTAEPSVALPEPLPPAEAEQVPLAAVVQEYERADSFTEITAVTRKYQNVPLLQRALRFLFPDLFPPSSTPGVETAATPGVERGVERRFPVLEPPPPAGRAVRRRVRTLPLARRSAPRPPAKPRREGGGRRRRAPEPAGAV